MQKRTLAVAAFAAVAGVSAHAATPFGEHVSLSGFGTIGAVVTDNDRDVFVRDMASEGATSRGSWVVDSRIGLQADFRAGWFGATAQVLAEQRIKPGVRADLEWGYLSFDPTPEFSMRVGRTAPAVFMFSDARNIGYSNTMLRMPNEVYSVNFLKRVYGADATYKLPLGASTLTVNGMAGKGTIPQGANQLNAPQVRGLNVTLDTPIGGFRVGEFRAHVDLPRYRTGLPEDYELPYRFTGYGYQYEGQQLRVAAEYVKRKVNSPLIPEMWANGWYVMAGYRVDKLTPYASIAGLKSGQLAVLSRTSGQQRSSTLGVRWDVTPGAAVKLQVEQVDPKHTVGGSFAATPVGPGDKTKVLGLAVDFIF